MFGDRSNIMGLLRQYGIAQQQESRTFDLSPFWHGGTRYFRSVSRVKIWAIDCGSFQAKDMPRRGSPEGARVPQPRVLTLGKPTLTIRPHKALPRSALVEKHPSAGLEVLKGRKIYTFNPAHSVHGMMNLGDNIEGLPKRC